MNQENTNSASTTGMDSDESFTVGEIEKATERAFRYQRHIARRTFGFYYLAWAAAILLVVATPNLSALVGLSGFLGEVFQLIVRLTALTGAAGTTAVIFRDARRILILRRYTGGLILWMYVVASAYLALSAYVVVNFLAPVSADFLAPYLHSVFYALLLPIPLLLYRLMSLAFPDRPPAEGRIALTTFAVAAAISLIGTLRALAVGFGFDANYYQVLGWVWEATALVWFLSAVYALFSAPDVLEALRS
jgi:hypothetical protein